MIRLVLFDIDGVLTNGNLSVDMHGNERKEINLRDVDAVNEFQRKGFLIGAITGENFGIVDYFRNKFKWDYFFSGCKNKVEVIKSIEQNDNIGREEIAYIGDSLYDIPPLQYVGFSACFADAILPVKRISKVVLRSRSNCGGLWELLDEVSLYNSSENHVFYEILDTQLNCLRLFHSYLCGSGFPVISTDDSVESMALQENILCLSQKIYNLRFQNNSLYIFGVYEKAEIFADLLRLTLGNKSRCFIHYYNAQEALAFDCVSKKIISSDDAVLIFCDIVTDDVLSLVNQVCSDTALSVLLCQQPDTINANVDMLLNFPKVDNASPYDMHYWVCNLVCSFLESL